MAPTNIAWVDKILAGVAEQEKVLDSNEEFVIVRDWKFDLKQKDDVLIFDRNNVHLLGIPRERIHSIRDLTVDHIPMLENIRKTALVVCEKMFGLQQNEIKVFFHYPPSTYHLHIHFTWVGLHNTATDFTRAIDFETVIRNIRMDPSYYHGELNFLDD